MTNDFSWAKFDENSLAHQAARDFLFLDVQVNPARAGDIIAVITQIQQGSIANWSGGGNAYFCDIDGSGAQLEMVLEGLNDQDIPLLPLSELNAALIAWQQYCEDKINSSHQ